MLPQFAPEIGVIRLRAVGQVKHPMLAKGQARMDRVPLNPGFEIDRVDFVSQSREYLGGSMEFSKSQ
jgi:hypothetical protein